MSSSRRSAPDTSRGVNSGAGAGALWAVYLHFIDAGLSIGIEDPDTHSLRSFVRDDKAGSSLNSLVRVTGKVLAAIAVRDTGPSTPALSHMLRGESRSPNACQPFYSSKRRHDDPY